MAQPQTLFFCDPDNTDTAFLSNVFPCKFMHNGILFRSVEHWMMYQKAKTFGDEAIAEQVLETMDPEATTMLGRRVKGFNSAQWAAKSLDVVVQGNVLKYTQSTSTGELLPTSQSSSRSSTPSSSPTSTSLTSSVFPTQNQLQSQTQSEQNAHETGKGPGIPLSTLLLSTNDAELVEAAAGDRRWGIGFSKSTAPGSSRAEWGENRSGKAAMKAREIVRASCEGGRGAGKLEILLKEDSSESLESKEGKITEGREAKDEGDSDEGNRSASEMSEDIMSQLSRSTTGSGSWSSRSSDSL